MVADQQGKSSQLNPNGGYAEVPVVERERDLRMVR